MNTLASGKASTLTFGSYALPSWSGPKYVIWHYTQNPYLWSVKLLSVEMGDRVIELSTDTAIIDSGTAFVIAPA